MNIPAIPPEAPPAPPQEPGLEAVVCSRRGQLVLSALLLLLVLLAFGVTATHGLTNWDDRENLVQNPHLAELGWSQLAWAFTTFHLGVYQPLGWVLLGLEWRLLGGHPGLLHLLSVLFHAVQSLLLWRLGDLLLARLAPESSLGVRRLAGWGAAVLFAVHPLRTEVVAWASCQPYIPSAIFFTLALISYLRGQAPSVGEDATVNLEAEVGRRRQLRWAALWFLLAVLFKAVALSLPALLILLDIFVLGRLGGKQGWLTPAARAVWLEKLPFLVIAAAAAALAVWAKREVDSLVPLQVAGLPSRLAQASYGLWFYLGKTLFPWPLHAYYVQPGRPSLSDATYLQCLSAAVVAATALVLLRRRAPGLLCAVASYVAVLLPNLGLVTVGAHLVADRYAYLASLPLVLALSVVLCRKAAHPAMSRRLVGGGAAVVAVLVLLSWRQSGTWSDPVTLWTHVVTHGGRNWISHTNLAEALSEAGRKDEAMQQHLEAYRLAPREARTNASVAAGLAEAGRLDEALRLFQEATRLRPDVVGYFGLGTTLSRLGRTEEAAGALRQGLSLDPHHADTLTNLAVLELGRGRTAEGAALLQRALAVNPEHAIARFNLGIMRFTAGDVAGAIAEYQRALKTQPDLAPARAALAEAIAAGASSPSPPGN